MKIIITGRNVDLTDAIKDRANDKLSKLDKFFPNETTATVTLKKENGKDMQLDMIGHSFFIYENTNNKICVAYKRDDGNFGIIEPDIE